MKRSIGSMDIYFEAGNKRTFAGAVEWPGWCRSGRDAESAVQALLNYAPRYARALRASRLGFHAATSFSELNVIERITGNATTDFGAPDIAPSADAKPFDDAELERRRAILKSCWRAFDAAVKAAKGKELRKGPRGRGRELEGIIEHVLGADEGYLGRIGWKVEKKGGADLAQQLARTHREVLKALEAAARNGVPERGPRGGIRWTPRYYVRRSAWHVLDHAWEIEDRIL